MTSGVKARLLHMMDVAIPAQPYPVASDTNVSVMRERPGPPASSGMWRFMRPAS